MALPGAGKMGSASGYGGPGIPGGRQLSLWLFQALLIAKSHHLSSLMIFFICFMFTLALNRLALLQAQNQVAFLLFFSYLASRKIQCPSCWLPQY